jgi:hypothetical protein
MDWSGLVEAPPFPGDASGWFSVRPAGGVGLSFLVLAFQSPGRGFTDLVPPGKPPARKFEGRPNRSDVQTGLRIRIPWQEQRLRNQPQRESLRSACGSGSFLFFSGKTASNSEHKTLRVTALGVLRFCQCCRVFPTDRVPRRDSLFAERVSGVRSKSGRSALAPPRSPLQLSMSLMNTPLRVNNPVSFGGPFSSFHQIHL